MRARKCWKADERNSTDVGGLDCLELDRQRLLRYDNLAVRFGDISYGKCSNKNMKGGCGGSRRPCVPKSFAS
jgi:hypothetical protein